MAIQSELSADTLGAVLPATGKRWLFSWPLIAAAFAYLYSWYRGKELLQDGDTYWHLATGRWMVEHGVIPNTDPFSHSMPGAAWTAHEWLSEIVLYFAHSLGGWASVVAVTGVAVAISMALLTRALLRWLEPIYALLFTGLAVALTSGHLLARPHIIALPLLMIWTIELVRAAEERRTPSLWLLPAMTLWANLHGGFTLGIALAGAFAVEALLAAESSRRLSTAKSWGIFLALALASSLITPHGIQGIYYTWHVLFNLEFALQRIGEWQSPDFHSPSVFELWLLGGFFLALYQGLRLPPVRLLLVLGVIHLALKHVRYIELAGLLVPLFVAAPFAAQWRTSSEGKNHSAGLDRAFRSLAQPASRTAVLACVALLALVSIVAARTHPVELPDMAVPVRAVDAVQKAGIRGPVLNSYSSGGYLIYRGIPVFIDGRADMYGDAFVKRYVEAMELRKTDGLDQLLDQYGIAWTLLEAHNSAVAMLDRKAGWRRLYSDESVVVHVRVPAGTVSPKS